MTKYKIDVAAARSAVSSARGEFDDLHGHEGLIEEAGELLADAVDESKINDALRENFTGFLKPWTVTFVNHGENLLDAADSIISAFIDADSKMEGAGSFAERGSIKSAVESIDDLPAYDPSRSSSMTSATSAANTHGGKDSNGSEGEGYDW